MGDAYGAAIIEHLSRAELAALPITTEEDPEDPNEDDNNYHTNTKVNYHMPNGSNGVAVQKEVSTKL